MEDPKSQNRGMLARGPCILEMGGPRMTRPWPGVSLVKFQYRFSHYSPPLQLLTPVIYTDNGEATAGAGWILNGHVRTLETRVDPAVKNKETVARCPPITPAG